MRRKLTITVHFDVPKSREVFVTKQAMDYATDQLINHLDDIVHDNGKGYFTLLTGPDFLDKAVVDFEWKKEKWK